MMKAIVGVLSVLGLAAAVLLPGSLNAQGSVTQIDEARLQKMVEAMGHDTKILDDETGKFEFTIEKDGYDVPIAIEVSESKNYVWLTVYLNETKSISGFSSNGLAYLRRIADTQPSHFWVTSRDRLMMGMAVDNRNVDAVLLRRVIEKLSKDVAGSASLWAK